MTKLTKQQVQQIAVNQVGASLANYMPKRPGQVYVNGSIVNVPVYGHQWNGVMNEAYENTVAEVQRIENGND